MMNSVWLFWASSQMLFFSGCESLNIAFRPPLIHLSFIFKPKTLIDKANLIRFSWY